MVKQIIIFLFFIFIEPIKRILSLFLYPLVYPFRKYLRTKNILWETYLYKPKIKLFWWLLNDSELLKYGVEYANNEKYYPDWAWNNGEFIRSWYFNAIRNSMVNFNNWVAFKLGHKLQCMKKWGSVNSFIELRLFAHGKKRLYSEFFIGKYWFQFGFISCGRFEIDIFKAREKK